MYQTLAYKIPSLEMSELQQALAEITFAVPSVQVCELVKQKQKELRSHICSGRIFIIKSIQQTINARSGTWESQQLENISTEARRGERGTWISENHFSLFDNLILLSRSLSRLKILKSIEGIHRNAD